MFVVGFSTGNEGCMYEFVGRGIFGCGIFGDTRGDVSSKSTELI
jgi:hypothetical protein